MTKLKEYTVVLVMNEADIVRSLPKEYYLVLLKCLLLRNFLYSGNAHKQYKLFKKHNASRLGQHSLVNAS